MNTNRISKLLVALLAMSVIIAACGSSAGATQTPLPTAVLATAYPSAPPTPSAIAPAVVVTAYPVATATQEAAVPTPTNTPVPTPMECTPDDVGDWNDRNELERLESAKQVAWLDSGRNYSIFLIVDTGEQVCVGVGSWDVQLIENRVTDVGLSERASVAPQSEYERGFTGKAIVEWTDRWEVESISIETPKVTGPNDGLVRSIWPDQMKKVNEAGARLFKEPIFDDTLSDESISPAYLCRRMGEWEQIAPLPNEVEFCHINWRYEVDSFLGNEYMLMAVTGRHDPFLKVFWIKPETVYLSESDEYPSESVKYEDAGTLVVGQKVSKDKEVLGTCEKPDKYDLERSPFRDSVIVRVSGGYRIVAPRSAYIGVGAQSGTGWEKIYRVCP